MELSELLLLLGSLATELATEVPRSLVSEGMAAGSFSACGPWTCSEHADVSRPSRTGKEAGLTVVIGGKDDVLLLSKVKTCVLGDRLQCSKTLCIDPTGWLRASDGDYSGGC